MSNIAYDHGHRGGAATESIRQRALLALSSCHPVQYWPAQKLLYRDAIGADDQLPRLRHRGTERSQAREPVACATALDFDGRDRLAGAHHEIDLGIAIAPVEHFAVARRCRVRQMRADSRLDEPSPKLSIATSLGKGHAG